PKKSSIIMEISDNHTNQVYCRCSLCAENGYGGAWVSRNTRSRHMKTERANRYQYSKPLNSELTSDDANTSSSTETQMSILEDNEYNTDNSTEIQIPIEDSLSGTTSENDHVIYDLDNSFENSSDELLSSSSSMMSYDEVSSDSSSVTDILQQAYQKLLPEKTIKEYHGLVFTTDSYDEVFYSPMQQYTLKRSEIKKIKEHYSTYYDVRARQLQVYLEVDIYSNNQRRTPVFEKRPFYGNIEYYLMYEFNNEKSMLAYINWTASVSTDSVGLKYFTKFAGYDFIDVIAVERCVGFIKVDNKYYIVDKEANNTIM
ncbi:20408_t:CDS:2, partial [Rhizophagus irregularis]